MTSRGPIPIHYVFPHNYEVELLESVALPAAPSRAVVDRDGVELHQFPGQLEEHDRTGIYIRVKPQSAEAWIGFFALGFDSEQVASGIYSCSDPRMLCVVVGGYAYIVNTNDPQNWVQIEQRPVVEVRVVLELKLLLFVGFTSISGLPESGKPWTTERLSWEGISVAAIQSSMLRGMGWDMLTDKEVPFEVDLLTGTSQGGAKPQTSHGRKN